MAEHVCISAIEFEDGSVAGQELARGTREQCERVYTSLPAVTYSGDKTAKQACLHIMPASEWDAIRSIPLRATDVRGEKERGNG